MCLCAHARPFLACGAFSFLFVNSYFVELCKKYVHLVLGKHKYLNFAVFLCVTLDSVTFLFKLHRSYRDQL